VHTHQLLKRLAGETASAEWAAKVLDKYLVADFDILSYLFSSDVRDDQDPSDPHDRTDDLLLVTPGALTLYRLTTKGLRAGSEGTEIESQRLEKAVVPLSHLASVHMVWESSRPFRGDAPDHDPVLHLMIQLDIEIPPLGRQLTLPLREREDAKDADSVRHQVETFAEALLLEMHDELQPVVQLEPEMAEDSLNGALTRGET
jgi:hypothetical protein